MLDRLRKALGYHVHEFGLWEQGGELVLTTKPDSVVGEVQTRTCKTCGIKQARRIFYAH